jgi:hypothetical protein
MLETKLKKKARKKLKINWLLVFEGIKTFVQLIVEILRRL